MKAIVHVEAFNEYGGRELIADLIKRGFKVKTIHKISDIKNFPIDWKTGNTLYYRTPQIRIPDPFAVAKYHQIHKNFAYILCNRGEYLSVNWNCVNLDKETLVIQGTFFIITMPTEVYLDNYELPLIIMYTKNRHEFFDFTFRSLKSSLGEDFKNQKIAVVLNDRNEKTFDVVNKITDEHDNVDILIPEVNAGVSSINLALQHYKTLGQRFKNFILCEDDFILPTVVKKLYPNWTRQFARKLEQFDVVGWGVSFNNRPIENYIPVRVGDNAVRFVTHLPEHPTSNNMWIASFEERLALGAQAVCMSTDFYKMLAYGRRDFSPCDEDFHSGARSYVTPRVVGYHLGWDQETMGYGSLLAPNKWPVVALQNTLEHSGGKTSYDLSNILNY